LGDAAHPTLPFLAQGANLALEDAAVFARAFERFVDLGQALTVYQKARAARVKKVVEAARLNGRAYHLEGAARSLSFGALRLGGKMAANIAFRRYRWIYDYDAMAAV
jgi:salicylate hydroxylase